MNESLERRVRKRAGDRCEYCKIPAYISEFTFPVDHIIAQQHGGKTSYVNLALSCPHDNFHKGPNIAGLDPETGKLTRLFNPRRQKWRRSLRMGRANTGRKDAHRENDSLCAQHEPPRPGGGSPTPDRGGSLPPVSRSGRLRRNETGTQLVRDKGGHS